MIVVAHPNRRTAARPSLGVKTRDSHGNSRRYRWWQVSGILVAAFAANAASGAPATTQATRPGPPRVRFTLPDWVFLLAWPLLKSAAARADLTIANLPVIQSRRRTLLALRATDWLLFATFTRVGPASGRPSQIVASTAAQASATAFACTLAAPIDRSITRLLAPQAAWLTYATAINVYGSWTTRHRGD